MKRQVKTNVLLAIGILSLSGCAGYDRILFATKTNVGLDIDDKPPTAEITVARRELAITPAFQDATGDEKTLPLLASFGLTGNFLNPEITSRFAGGNAALIIARGPNQTTTTLDGHDPSLCLNKKPDMRPLWKKIWHFVTFQDKKNVEDDTRAFFFATDTAFGLKAAWDGVTGPYPSTLKLGYNRRELAFPPVFATAASTCEPKPDNTAMESAGEHGRPDNTINKGTGEQNKKDNEEGWWKVTVPSFVAALDNSSTLKERFESGVTHIQFFATGQAASDFVKRPEVNAAMNRTMYRRNDLFVTPETAAVMVGGKKIFNTAGGKGPVRLTLMHDAAIAGQFSPSTGEYTAGTIPGTYGIVQMSVEIF